MLKRGATLVIYYRYPCEDVPRTTTVRYTGPNSILDAVALAISKDANLPGISTSETPTLTLANLLSETMRHDARCEHIRYAMTYASIQPPQYHPKETKIVTKRKACADLSDVKKRFRT